MTVIYCDVTGKEIEHATQTYSWRTRNRRYKVVRGRDFSIEGYQKLESEVYNVMSKRERFNFKEYKQTLADKIASLTD
jgi:hypothetical protein